MTELEPAPLSLIAYVINPALAMPLVCATRARAWMEETDQRFANRCLPLLMANQAGWFLLSAHSVRVTWTGTNDMAGVRVEHLSGAPPSPVLSHFGHGIVTWNVPYLFRTPPGYNLLIRGPANWPKDGIVPLEGLVESDWSAATFTINWRLTRAHHPVTFEEGEPIGLLVPQRRDELESFHPELRRLDSAPETSELYQSWARSRAEFNAELVKPGSSAAKQRWQKDYFQGLAGGVRATEQHQTKLTLRDFVDLRGEPEAAAPEPEPATTTTTGGLSPVAATPPPAPALPSADAMLEELIVQDDFISPESCRALIDVHRRFGTLGTDSDNGYPLALARQSDPERFQLARAVIERLIALIAERYHATVGCDLALLCALVPGFRHALHADNALISCPRHGDDAEQLVRSGCQCPDVEVRPNHTPWRGYSALICLDDQHQGGDTVFGEGPNVYGRSYRKQIQARPGLLVLNPSNQLYYNQTTPVESGVCYSMNLWFAAGADHIAPDWT